MLHRIGSVLYSLQLRRGYNEGWNFEVAGQVVTMSTRTRTPDAYRSGPRDRPRAGRWSFEQRCGRWSAVHTTLAAAGLFLSAMVLPGCPANRGTHAVRSETAAMTGVRSEEPSDSLGPGGETNKPTATPAMAAEYIRRREAMVEHQLRARDITDPRVLDAMGKVPRHEFVPADLRESAYTDGPLPIGHGQTISQPYIVALMTQLVRPKADAHALDVGTGSGYQAAVLAGLVGKVYSIEIIPELATQARQRLKRLGYTNIEVRCGDGYQGWPEHAPFDVIILAAAPAHIPPPLMDQLAPGGRLVLPLGRHFQKLVVIVKKVDGTITRRTVAAVSFVPMTGRAQKD